jgi:O-acetylhomoserine/O-acetylserine sulfhydrylase-like pyridoxal-dependent enzyme
VVQVLAAKIAALEGTENAIVLASGIAGVIATMLSLLNPGDHFITQAHHL